MSLKKSSDAIDLEYNSCVLPGNSSDSLQPKDGFVLVELFSLSNTDMLFEEQRSSEGAIIYECIDESPIKPEQGTSIDNTLMSDFIEDVSYDYHVDQYDSTVKKVSHNKKKITNKQNPSHKRISTLKATRPQEEQVLNIDVFDEPTAEILKSIVSTSNYYRGNFGNIISNGQNSVVVHAYILKKVYPSWEPGGKPILLYATINNEYNKRYRNWRSEDNAVKVYKLCDDEIKNKRIFQQVQKEREHLSFLNKAKCNVPEVRRCSQNIIVMSLVGADGVTAPTIDTLATHPLKRSEAMYHTIVKDMEMWYKTLHLIHGKLSAENILFWNKEVYYIEWSHSVKSEHPLALKKLMKDCRFITKFFDSRGVPVRPVEKLFTDISGLNDIDESVLSVINSKVPKDLWKKQHLTNPNRRPSSHTLSPRRSGWFK